VARIEPLTPGIDRRRLLGALVFPAGLAAAPAATSAAPPGPTLRLAGQARQGGTLIGRTLPGAGISLDGVVMGQASPGGLFIVGLDRDSPAEVVVSASLDGKQINERRVAVAPGDFDIQRIDGLPSQQVRPQGEALLARIAAEAERKARGWASEVTTEDFAGGFTRPLRKFRLSGRFGGQRILNGEPMTPHYGADLAAPEGTPILAPAPGRVCFAETGLHYEGGLTMIDHGQGLVTAYLHQSVLRVREGDAVVRGQVIGAVGREGRATGPHLCWRMKWRDRRLDPMLLLGVRAPA
jgi:murein DD-endopeptidase MepM/ murein hydrolase activator NlpD